MTAYWLLITGYCCHPEHFGKLSTGSSKGVAMSGVEGWELVDM